MNTRNFRNLGICPYLKGTSQGANCGASNRLVKELPDIDIRVCMSRHHEACSIYFCSLQTVWDGSTFEPSKCAEM
ncbi:MAG: hypothetical protein HQL09_01175 [Nitrospirae bacterium]|nr:hypothetical protein [Nitrospirota bacterium]